MRKIFLISILFCGGLQVYAQDSVQARIVLVGDAGALINGKQPVIDAIKKHTIIDEKTTVVYLGDNLYKVGLPDNSLPTYALAKAPLDSQINIANTTKTKVYFIPGNHDWANGGSNGYENILRVQSYIDLLSNSNVSQLPRDGCPGPVEVKINNDVTLIIMDSQWWLHEAEKPGIESDCPYKTEAEILTQLDELLSKNSSKLVVLAMHHPFKSNGPHGGYFTLKQHIFPFTDARPNLYIPLPLIGSAYPLTRAVFGTAQDLKHPLYQHMISSISSITKGYNNIIQVAGHEHTLQYIVDSSKYYIVSGAGSDKNRVSKARNTKYASSNYGYAVLEISKNKNVDVKFYEVHTDSVKEAYSNHVMNFSKPPLPIPDTLRKVEFAFEDSVVISASDLYKNWNGFKKVFLGTNYRREWNQPISLKVFNISKEKGGLTIKSLGGGKQTKSLKLVDKSGKEWTLRSVDKDPEKALPPNLRGTLAQKIVQDMISASHPYAPLVVPDLANALGIIAVKPQFFFVPDDPALGAYRENFANSVCMLEDREPTINDKNRKEESKSTNKIMNKMLEDNEHHVDQEKVLYARLLDMLIGDFDRHADQWRWGTDDTGKGKLYYPIPRDRDQAFFRSDGLLVGFLKGATMPFLEGFNSKIKNINGLNFVARDFDRVFLNSLDEPTWRRILADFQLKLTDDVIDKSVTNLPAAIAYYDAANIAAKLKSRRDDLVKDGMRYYKFLTERVTVGGSNKSEYFHIQKHPLGLVLTAYKKSEKTDSGAVMYKRIFDDRRTKELVIYSLNGDDKFEIDEDVRSKIKLRLIGGKGADTFNLKGRVLSFVYDLTTEKNAFVKARRTNKELSANPTVNAYRNSGFKYNSFEFPQLNVGANAEDGFLFGIGFNTRTYGFRQEPFSTSQKLSTLFAPNHKAYQATYRGEFNHVVSKYDLVINADLVNPTLNNFFGLGNETTFDKSLPVEFYRVRYKYVAADLLLRKRVNDIIHVSAGPSYYHYWNNYEDNRNRILSKPATIGSDSAKIFSKKDYLGGRSRIEIRYVNNELIPTRGITWFNDLLVLRGFNDNTHALTKLTSDMTIYASVSTQSAISAIFKFGGGHIFSRNFEYFQAINLGANNYLRGFRKNRFSAKSSAYSSAEMRVRLGTSKGYLLPGDFGLVGFYDLGRVWMSGENSKKWHNDFGGGLYYIPYGLVSVTATVGISKEDKLFNFSLGTRFNLTF
ncbi:MAG: metallophosphoesterase [Ferruginibacter sp.]